MIEVTTDGDGQPSALSRDTGYRYHRTVEGLVVVVNSAGKRVTTLGHMESVPVSSTGFQRWVAQQDRVIPKRIENDPFPIQNPRFLAAFVGFVLVVTTVVYVVT